MSSDTWEPEQYEKFLRERSAPFFDLLGMVRKKPGMRVADLGCGTGELTRRLHEALEPRETLGIDSSGKMLEKAAEFAVKGLRFERRDIAAFAPRKPYDLLFSNAALHFLPRHEELLPRLAGYVTGDGQIAVHLPANQDHPTHVTARQVAADPPFHGALGGYHHPTNVLPVEVYATLLHKLGFREQQVRMNVYTHLLEGPESLVEWVKGSILNEYRSRLSPELWEEFLASYRERLLACVPDDRPFFFTFKRVLIWGAR